jgi:hypothetical protein
MAGRKWAVRLRRGKRSASICSTDCRAASFVNSGSRPCLPPWFRFGIIDQGITGAIVDTMDEAVRMLPQVLALDRRAVRRRFEQRFSSARMASDYVALYRSLLERPSILERETTVPLARPALEKKPNGQGLHGDRARRAAETDGLR